ncbi:hypothetical protein CR513_10412, partial [Mucuna pruriens]
MRRILISWVLGKTLMDQKKKLKPKRSQVKVDPIQRLWKVASKVGCQNNRKKLYCPTIPMPKGYFGDMYIRQLCLLKGRKHLSGFIDPLRFQTVGHNLDKEIHKILD